FLVLGYSEGTFWSSRAPSLSSRAPSLSSRAPSLSSRATARDLHFRRSASRQLQIPRFARNDIRSLGTIKGPALVIPSGLLNHPKPSLCHPERQRGICTFRRDARRQLQIPR